MKREHEIKICSSQETTRVQPPEMNWRMIIECKLWIRARKLAAVTNDPPSLADFDQLLTILLSIRESVNYELNS